MKFRTIFSLGVLSFAAACSVDSSAPAPGEGALNPDGSAENAEATEAAAATTDAAPAVPSAIAADEGPDGATVAFSRAAADYSLFTVKGEAENLDNGATVNVDDAYIMVSDLSKVDSAPLPKKLRDEIKAEVAGYGDELNDVVIVNKKEAESYAASYALCPAKDANFSRKLTKSGSWSKDIDADDFDGKLKVSAKIDNETFLDVKMKTHCKVWVRFNRVKLTNAFEATLTGEAVGKAKASFSKSVTIAEPKIFNKVIMFGWIPVWITVSVPIEGAVKVSAKGEVSVKAVFNAKSDHAFECKRGEGCTHTQSGSKDFDVSSPTVQLNSRVTITPSLTVSGKVALYKGAAWGQAGVRLGVQGDYWAYHGNTCGDKDNDGTNETVTAQTLDVRLPLDFVAKAGFFKKSVANYSKNINTWDLGFFKLGSAQSALDPIFYNQSFSDAGQAHDSMRGAIRPCWPYRADINYAIKWADGSTEKFTLSPTSAPFWKHNPKKGNVTLQVVSDKDGRAIGGSRTAAYQGF